MNKARSKLGHRRTWGLILGVVALFVWWTLRAPPKRPLEPSPAVAATETPLPMQLPSYVPPEPVKPEPAKKVLSDLPIIDEILVEKPSVCQGEDNLITVRAHTENGTDASLHYSIGTGTGNPFPLRTWSHPDSARIPGPVVRVFNGDGKVTVAPVPKYEVRDCVLSRVLNVTAALRPNTSSEFTVTASVAEPPATGRTRRTSFTPARFLWDFGDGAKETTADNVVVHSYEDRPQSGLQSDFLVTAHAVAVDGTELVGRTTLSLRNPAFEMATKDTVAIMTSLNPRFPSRDAEGNVTEEVHLWHHATEGVRIERVRVTRSYQDGHMGPTEVRDPFGVLGTNAIPPGKEGIRTSLTLAVGEDPTVVAVNYDVDGTSNDGRFATTRFSVMRPPVRTPITDPEILAKIASAQQLLHQDTVTYADLERIGKDNKLKP
jgi:hypothetical protein